jgi:hypothetical protein
MYKSSITGIASTQTPYSDPHGARGYIDLFCKFVNWLVFELNEGLVKKGMKGKVWIFSSVIPKKCNEILVNRLFQRVGQ